MDNRDVQVVIAVILAGIVGFALATVLMNDDDEPVVETAATTVQETTATTPATTTETPTQTQTTPPATTTDAAPTTEGPDDASCIELWNRDNNTSPQAFLADLQNRQAVRVNVGATAVAPQRCLVTLIANDGSVFRFTEAGGRAFPYSPQPARMRSSALTPDERETDALPETGGRLSAR